MARLTAIIGRYKNPVDQLINVAARMHACQTQDDIERRWPQVVATLQWVARRRQLTTEHILAATDWLIAAANTGPFAGEPGEAYRQQVEQLIASILGKAPPPPWTTQPPPQGTDFPGLARIPHSEPTPIPPATGPTPARPSRGSGPSGGFPA
jgi:hypothetical protein